MDASYSTMVYRNCDSYIASIAKLEHATTDFKGKIIVTVFASIRD